MNILNYIIVARDLEETMGSILPNAVLLGFFLQLPYSSLGVI